jgi:uncharacterized protein YabN with tetrapyrrole methylase and pyrophosphatase domain
LASQPDAGSIPAGEVQELLYVIAALREHCPWMGALTHASLVEYLLEEAFEVAETIEAAAPAEEQDAAGPVNVQGIDDAELLGELGDVLLQVVLHARLAEERGAFTFDDVARGLSAKMVRRNPHVFRPDGSLQDTFPATVEEIVQKWDAVKRTERPERQDPFAGIPLALPALAIPGTEEELGELLLAVVHSARTSGFDAERALRGAVRRYQQG